MQNKQPYEAPGIAAEDQMEQTALQTCWVTEPYDGQDGFGNFVVADCQNPVEKGGAFDAVSACESVWPPTADNKAAEPFS